MTEQIKDCDLYFNCDYKPCYNPFYDNLSHTSRVRNELDLRVAWQKLKVGLGDVPRDISFDEKRNFFIINFTDQLRRFGNDFRNALSSYIGFLDKPPVYAYVNNEGEEDLVQALEENERGIMPRIQSSLLDRIKNPDLRIPRRTFPLDESQSSLLKEPVKTYVKGRLFVN